jgi:hypothetical protein
MVTTGVLSNEHDPSRALQKNGNFMHTMIGSSASLKTATRGR